MPTPTMTLTEAVDILWEQTQEFFGPSDKEYPRSFIGAFIYFARTCHMQTYTPQAMTALATFADAKLRDVRAELELLWSQINTEA